MYVLSKNGVILRHRTYAINQDGEERNQERNDSKIKISIQLKAAATTTTTTTKMKANSLGIFNRQILAYII